MTRLITVAALLLLAMRMAVCAQDELVGTWEQVIDPQEEFESSARLTLEADHTVEFFIEVVFPPEFFDIPGDGGEGEGGFDIEGGVLPDIPLFPEGYALKAVVRGSWEAQDGELTLRSDEIEITLDDLTVDKFFATAASDLAALLAEEEGIADEDFPEFEEAVVAIFMLQSDPEEFEKSFKEAFAGERITAYEVDGNSLFYFEDGEVSTEFRRVAASVVSESSWGQVKTSFSSSLRP